MALPNDSHVGGAATTFATHTISGKEYPVGMTADQDGHIAGSLPAFGLVIPPAAAAAGSATVMRFDLFNAQAATIIRLRKLFALVATDAAVTGTLGIRLDVHRTSTVGTGGTAAVANGATTTAPTIYGFNSANVLPAGITARAGTTAGATSAAWLFPTWLFGEETSTSAHDSQWQNMLPEMAKDQALELNTGQGVKVTQGTVASAGSYGFLACFTVE